MNMNRREFVASASAGLVGLTQSRQVAAQGSGATVDLADLLAGNRLVVVNRTASRLVDGARTGVRLSAAAGDGRALWDKLRSEQPGEYEQRIDPVPDPNAWFHARIVLSAGAVRVFVARAANPCLGVKLLNSRPTGLVGLWVGNNSDGDFANLSIVPA